MSIREGQTTVSAVISKDLRAMVEHQAHMADMSLSKYVAEIISQHATGELMIEQPLKVRTMDNRGRIKLPRDLVAALDIQPTTPLAIFPFHRGVLIRPVR